MSSSIRLELAAGEELDVADLLHVVDSRGSAAGDLEAHAADSVVVDAEQVRLRADERHQRHHELLADRIDRRIGDLREQLLEVVVEAPSAGSTAPAARESLPIEPIGSSPFVRHRRQDELQVFLRVAERLLAVEQRHRPTAAAARARAARRARRASARSTRDTACAVASVRFSSSSSTMRPCFEVDEQHLARLQPPLLDDLALRECRARRLPTP